MKAVVYKGPRQVAVENVPDPTIVNPDDVIIKITSTALCGSDLHMYEGRTVLPPGTIMGHENMGTIEAIGNGVETLKVGDRVVVPFNISCGHCANCNRGLTCFCLNMNKQKVGAIYGYVGGGSYPGGQAEYLRVPHGEFNCLKLPPDNVHEDDFMMLADIFPTGYHGTELANVSPGDSVVIFGAGPVGYMAALSAIIKGAAPVYSVDGIPGRLQKVARIGAIPINMYDGDPVQQIIQKHGRPVDKGIDAVGYEAINPSTGQQDPTIILRSLIEVVGTGGNLGIIGVYVSQDPGGIDQAAKSGEIQIPWGKLFEKGLRLGTGQCPVKRYNRKLRDLIIEGKVKPGAIVSHHHKLDEAPIAYDKFDRRVEGYTKVIFHP